MTSLTTEQIEKILDGAPEGATHVEIVEYSDNPETLEFLMYSNDYWHERDRGAWVVDSSGRICCYADIRSLSDLREILALRKRVQELEFKKDSQAITMLFALGAHLTTMKTP